MFTSSRALLDTGVPISSLGWITVSPLASVQQVLVQAKNNEQRSTLVAGKIVKGTLQLTQKEIVTQDYAAENKGDADKTLVIEHGRLGGEWKLTAPAKADETTDSLYRFKGKVAAGKGGQFSKASANKRPSTPTVCSASARVPANGPRPAAISKIEAHTSSGTERSTLSTARVALRAKGPKRPLAGRASSAPTSAAITVPMATGRVSNVATPLS